MSGNIFRHLLARTVENFLIISSDSLDKAINGLNPTKVRDVTRHKKITNSLLMRNS